jgi:glucose/arabinose dehydrogenase
LHNTRKYVSIHLNFVMLCSVVSQKMIFIKFCLVILILVTIFSPFFLTETVNASSPLEPSSINTRSNIPIALPIESNRNSGSPIEDKHLSNIGNHATTVLRKETQRMDNGVTAFSICNALPITSVIANGNDGNVPSNVIDNNLNTRWSNDGQGSWIQLDLGSRKNVCSVDVAWYRGNLRENDFVISVSDNGNTFTNKFSGTSSGTTTSFEKYTLPAGTEGRYVRIIVNGNTENNWASITEIAVYGVGESESPAITPGPMYHKWQTAAGSNTWSGWGGLSGSIKGNPTVALNSDGRLEVFVVGPDNALYHKWQTAAGSNTWSGWSSLQGGIKSNTDPAVVRNSDGRLEVFVVGSNNQLYHKWQSSAGSSTWTLWQSLGGTLRDGSSPAVIANSDGRLEVFVIGTNNALFHKWQTSAGSSTWSAYESLGGGIKSNTDPAIARNSDGRLEVFVIDTHNSLFHKWQTSAGSNTWSQWSSLGGGIAPNSSPALARNSDGRLEVFVIGTDNELYHKWQTTSNGALPIVKDPNLTVEHFVDGLDEPTSMAFIDNNQILVLEKNGNVRLVSNGQLQAQSILQVPVNTQSERGLLGIAALGNSVFLYYTESGGTELRNRVYKYTWDGQNLENPILLLDLPALPGANHDGGKLMIGRDNFLYAVIGDLNRDGKLQNFAIGPDPDDTSVILRVSPNDGSPAPGNPLSSDPNNPLSKYYAYGIRNSFGIAFDPVNGRIWDTENGPNVFDEINSVSPGFNSGWEKVMGPISLSGMTEADLVNFPGSDYADPVLNWRQPIGITDLEFLSSSELGSPYNNDLFVGDINNGNLYHFNLNAPRTGFILSHPGLSDLIVDNSQELASITLGSGFAGITDILTGPDGLLYILSFSDGKIFRIIQTP